MAITQTQLGATSGAVYTSSGNSMIITMYVCNTDSVSRTFSLWVVKSGDSADDTTLIYKDVNVPAGDTYVIPSDEKLELANADAIHGIAAAATVLTMTVSHTSVD